MNGSPARPNIDQPSAHRFARTELISDGERLWSGEGGETGGVVKNFDFEGVFSAAYTNSTVRHQRL
jgi:hypothetical protein